MTEQTAPPAERGELTASEVVQSLTGWEEDDIARQWGGKVHDLADHDKNRLLRALYYVCRKRRGDTAKEAFKRAQDCPIKDVADYFPDEESDPDAAEQAEGNSDA